MFPKVVKNQKTRAKTKAAVTRPGQNPDFFPLLQQFPGNFFGGQALIQQIQGVFDKNTQADGDGSAVYHKYFAGKFGGCNVGALVGAGELSCAGQADHLITGFHSFPECFFEDIGGRLAGGGQHVAFHQLLVKCPVGLYDMNRMITGE
jgi:hypothetical protein